MATKILTSKGQALIGLNSFNEIIKAQKCQGGDIYLFSLKNGERIWKAEGDIYAPLYLGDVLPQITGEDDYCVIENEEDLDNEILNQKALLDGLDEEDISSAEKTLGSIANKIRNELPFLKREEALIVSFNNDEIEVLPKEIIRYSDERRGEKFEIGLLI